MSTQRAIDLPSQEQRLLPPPGQPIIDLAEHIARYGPLPYRGGRGFLIDDVAEAGLTGRGGAAFPLHRKLTAVAAIGWRVAGSLAATPRTRLVPELLAQAPRR